MSFFEDFISPDKLSRKNWSYSMIHTVRLMEM